MGGKFRELWGNAGNCGEMQGNARNVRICREIQGNVRKLHGNAVNCREM
jgi:hypothetical protein